MKFATRRHGNRPLGIPLRGTVPHLESRRGVNGVTSWMSRGGVFFVNSNRFKKIARECVSIVNKNRMRHEDIRIQAVYCMTFK